MICSILFELESVTLCGRETYIILNGEILEKARERGGDGKSEREGGKLGGKKTREKRKGNKMKGKNKYYMKRWERKMSKESFASWNQRNNK